MRFTLALLVAFVLGGCDLYGPDPAPAGVHVPVPEGFDELPVPPQNPALAERIRLGERLFFDPILSGNQTISCGSCHLPERAFADLTRRSIGIQGRVGLRNAPSLLNTAYRTSLFWDGGALFLESQALVPLEDENEMNLPIDEALRRLSEHHDYPALFASAFDGEAPSVRTLSYALAAYQRTLVSAPIRLDRYRAGERNALTAPEQRGLALFETHCSSCHAGPLLTTEGFANNGVSVTDEDPGRQRITHDPADRGVFRIPSLRGLARTAPYFHDGRFFSLEEVVGYYVAGGDGGAGQDARIQPLALSAEDQADLIRFLQTLDDEAVEVDYFSD
ncbi:MAG: cytochrome c peroxidase [Bacteroidota bacterium]